MDGTVLNSKSELTERNKNILEKAQKANIHIVLCTGRTMTELFPVLDVFQTSRYAICTNGGFVIDLKTQKRLHENLLPLKEAKKAFTMSEGIDSVFEFFADGKAYMEKYGFDNTEAYHLGRFKELMKKTCIPVENLQNFLVERGKPVEKINIFCRHISDRETVFNRCKKLNAAVTFSLENNVEINSTEATKGKGLEFLSGHLNIDKKDIIAFGDSSNDISMLEYAGISVAMGNSAQAIKSLAAITAPSNDESGVAAILENFVE